VGVHAGLARQKWSAETRAESGVALDEMNPPLAKLHGKRLWAARQSLAMNWSHPDDIRADVLNRILWWDAKGYDTPYPAR